MSILTMMFAVYEPFVPDDLASALSGALMCAGFTLFAVGPDSVVARRIPGLIVVFALGIWSLLAVTTMPRFSLSSAIADNSVLPRRSRSC